MIMQMLTMIIQSIIILIIVILFGDIIKNKLYNNSSDKSLKESFDKYIPYFRQMKVEDLNLTYAELTELMLRNQALLNVCRDNLTEDLEECFNQQKENEK